MSTATLPMYEWKTIPWAKLQRNVFKLQKRIYQASLRDDTDTVHKLQRLLLASQSARLLATRRVTQDNKGKNTPGVDQQARLRPKERMEFAHLLHFGKIPSPLRRVWIPKPRTQEKRPLGIPTLWDRALQAWVKLAMEPEWEAKFSPHSYGFRPGRGCHDAVEDIFNSIVKRPKFVLDADITKCFDRINHEALLAKLGTFPFLRRIIKGWLQAGVLDNRELRPTITGSAQGGVISPLLANVALHGLEKAILDAFPATTVSEGKKTNWKPRVIVYADDFIVLHHEWETITRCRDIAVQWLSAMGLELNPEKTHITHTLKMDEQRPGFNFLGFNIRQHPVGRTHSGHDNVGRLLGHKTLIKPSREGIARHVERLRETIKTHRGVSTEILVRRLNQTIRGWSLYYSTVCSKATFSKLSKILFSMLFPWAKRRHANKTTKWVIRHYWRLQNGRKYFQSESGIRLTDHAEIPIRRHIKVIGAQSPFDGNWLYWATRMGRHPELDAKTALLLKSQQGKCVKCGTYFVDGDHLHKHRYRLASGKQHVQLLHGFCR
jgi:RNA-directed DNA polymerase